MAFRRFLTATLLLFARSTYGDHQLGENEDLAGSSDSDKPAPDNLKTADDVSRQEGKANFAGLNICGFDFGW